MGLRDKEQLAHQQLQLCTQSGSISGAPAPFKELRQEKSGATSPLPKSVAYLPIILPSPILFLRRTTTPVIAFYVNYCLS